MFENVKRSAIYVHFPFCLRKCPYCDFVSYDSSPVNRDEYIDSILLELGSLQKDIGVPLEAASVYLGGGTPSLMTPRQVEKLLDGIKRHAPFPADAEITIEVNPATAGEAGMAAWRSMGINRISLGIQSTDPKILVKLERVHTVEEGIMTYRFARRVGFFSVGIDLIFGVPGQSFESWKADLLRAIELEPDHLSAYMLKAPQGWEPPCEEELADMYTFTVDELEAAGLFQYEVSNFARPGYESRHNLTYWKMGEYIGLGVAAHSHMSWSNRPARSDSPHPLNKDPHQNNIFSIRWWNTPGPEDYINKINEKGNAISDYEYIDMEKSIYENLLLSLRLREGLDMGLKAFKSRKAIESVGAHLEEGGLASIEGSILKLTPRGLLLADEIAARIAASVSNGEGS